jgi:hypothetical protein
MPSSVFTYTDVDGDKVTITSSVGALNDGNVLRTSFGIGARCLELLLGPTFAGANITFSVTRAPAGDGLANVGTIMAAGTDLGNVTVNGDLLAISCGAGNRDNPALKSLNVRSMGRFGTVDGQGNLESVIAGALGALWVSGDVKGAYIHVTGDAIGTIGSVTVGGSVLGGSNFASGVIYCTGDMGPVKIGRDLIGGSGMSSGQVGSGTKTGPVTIGGSVIGGSGAYSGLIFGSTSIGPVRIGNNLVGGSALQSGSVALLGKSGTITSVSVGGSIVGGGGDLSGTVRAGLPDDGASATAMGNVTVGGSLLGGVGKNSGTIYSGGGLGTVRISRDIHGGAGQFSGAVRTLGAMTAIAVGGSVGGGASEESGAIHVGDVSGRIAVAGSLVGSYGNTSGAVVARAVDNISIGGDLVGGSITDSLVGLTCSGCIVVQTAQHITIGGSMIAGSDNSTGYLLSSASITAGSIGAITVRGNIVGNVTQAARIYISGKPEGAAGDALGSLTVGGNVEWAIVESTSPDVPANTRIGTVHVGGDWIASSLASGAIPRNGIYDSDSLIDFDASRIAAVVIGGTIMGTFQRTTTFAFVAHEIGAFRVGQRVLPLRAGVRDAIFTFSWDTAGNVAMFEL